MDGEHNILLGNADSILKKLAANPKEQNKYRLIVTSPPYYRHRNYGQKSEEIGQEKSVEEYLDRMAGVFIKCKELLTDDGSLFIVIGDTRQKHAKLMIPHRLAIKLTDAGYIFQEDIVWYKRNAVPTRAKTSLTQQYEVILFLSKNKKPHLNIDQIRVKGNDAVAGTKKIPPDNMMQYKSHGEDSKAIKKIKDVIHNSSSKISFADLPTTSEISLAYGYEPEKCCPTCYRKFKRHISRKRIKGHEHYPIFAACNPKGKNPGNVWEISTKAHHGSEHFAIFPEDLVAKIIKFTTDKGDHILDPFAGRGTSGIVAVHLKRKFTGIDLYKTNVANIRKNIKDAIDSKLSQKIISQIDT